MLEGYVSLLPLGAGGKAWRVLVMQCFVCSLTIQPGMQRGSGVVVRWVKWIESCKATDKCGDSRLHVC